MSQSQIDGGYPGNSSIGHTDDSFGGLHHSAPNSPVFTKKQTQNDMPNHHINYHQNHFKRTRNQNAKHTSLQSSNSMTNNSNYTFYNNNNNHINKSPTTTVSQPSSNSSSEMNLLQELEQHALFKTPVVNRSVSFYIYKKKKKTFHSFQFRFCFFFFFYCLFRIFDIFNFSFICYGFKTVWFLYVFLYPLPQKPPTVCTCIFFSKLVMHNIYIIKLFMFVFIWL